ncbi:MAG: TonB-dependent receptor [Chthoniobacterales bacterium]|nr:TonB-dependent receptor [Chthoniobacterales bacterium]
MNRSVLTKLNFVRTALAASVGIPFLIASSAFAQGPTTGPSPAADVPNAPVQAAPAAVQQQGTSAGGGEATAERIIVTGSYIPTAETESALPVTVYTAEVITKQGAQTPAEGLRQLPSFVGNTATENDSNGGDGTAFINLRALGAGNTLTLINGRRTFALGFQDINLIGLGSLSRTEILKDGASSIYGSDAVAGVVNFILLDGPNEAPLEGGELFALYGNTTDTDANVRQFYLRGGVTGLDGKFAVAASVEYYVRANLLSHDRLIASTGDTSNDATGLGLGGANTNSPTFAGRINLLNADGITSTRYVLSNLSNNAPTSLADYRLFDVPPSTDPARFNFRSVTPAIPAQERFDYYVTANYKVFGDGLQLYGDILYSHLTQDNGLAGAPFAINAFTGSTAFPNTTFDGTTGDLPIVQQSQFNPFGNRVTEVRYRLQQDLGNRRSFFDKDAWRYVAAAKGDFNFKDNGFISHFGYDTGFVYERFDEIETDSGDATESGIDQEILAGNFDIFIGQTAPVTGVAPIYNNTNPAAPNFQNGVPIGTAAYDNAAAAQRASFIATTQFLGRAYLVDAKFNAHLFPNLYNGGIDIAGGYEHREVRTQTIADEIQGQNDQLGFSGGADDKFTTRVDSVFGELSIPFVTSTMNIPGVKTLELSLAYRYEKFDLEDNLNKNNNASFDNSNPDENFGGSPRLALRYQPIADLTLRATASQSFQAPSPGQLFNPVIQNFPNLFDPVAGTVLQPPLGVYQRGNPALLPETTDSYTAGIVYSPKFVPGLTVTADYYNLFTTNLILPAAAAAQVFLTQNVIDPDGFGNNSPLAPGGPGVGITRDASGQLLAIDADTNNAGRRNVQGLDLTAVYQIPTQNLGTFTASGGLNHFFTYKIEPLLGGGYTNFLGNYNNGSLPLAPGAIPFNKGFLRGEWEFKGFDFVATGNYIGEYEDDPSFLLANLTAPNRGIIGNTGGTANPEFAFHRRVTSYVTLDMQLSYTFPKPAPVEAAPAPGYSKEANDGKGMVQQQASVSTADNSASIFSRLLWDTKLTVGVNNAFDRNPPTVLGAFNDNYDTSLYSIRNRYYYVSLTKKF